MDNKEKKYERTGKPLRINEIIRKEYPLLAERIEISKRNIQKKKWRELEQ